MIIMESHIHDFLASIHGHVPVDFSFGYFDWVLILYVYFQLQQYRQKKDTKGKDGKGKDGKSSSRSTSKADKFEQDEADANSVSAAGTKKAESSQASGAEVELLVNSVDSIIDTQKALENSEGTSADTQNAVDNNVFVETSSNREPDCSTPTKGEVEIDAHEVEGSGTSESTKSNTVHDDVLAVATDSSPEAASDAEMVAAVFVEAKGQLVGDQVSVVGCAFFLLHRLLCFHLFHSPLSSAT